MSKVLNDTEVLDIVARIVTTDEVIPEGEVYGKFLKDLGNLVASYCGGECVAVSKPLGDGDPNDTWGVHFRADDAVPADGGVYATYDTDVSVEEWKQEVDPDRNGSEQEHDERVMFLNEYRCPRCLAEWSSKDEAQPDDDCPKCGNRHISPRNSFELGVIHA